MVCLFLLTYIEGLCFIGSKLSDIMSLVIQVLCIQGFLTCRKHAERIILLVEMLQVISCNLCHVGPDFPMPTFIF